MDATGLIILLACLINAAVTQPSQEERSPRKRNHICHNNGEAYVLNSCEERCLCRNGTLKDCYRVRKEFTSMSIKERIRFINAYKLGSTHRLFKQRYEQLVAYHFGIPDQLLHRSPEIFLPWHRWWLFQWERFLRKIDCRLTIPYWDWSRVASHWWRATHEEDIWNPGPHGLGGNGNPPEYCVSDGPFRKEAWNLTRLASSKCLKRNFLLTQRLVSTSAVVNRAVQLPVSMFSEFENIVRSIFHADMHDWIGGTMFSPDAASNAPEIIPHHAFLDKIWSEWQSKGEEFKTVYFHSINRKMPETDYFPWQFLDNDNLPGGVKVQYE